MALLRKLGRGKKNGLEVLRLLEYTYDISGEKRTWNGTTIPAEELVMAYGLPCDPIEATGEMLGLHDSFYTPPHSCLVHHILFDLEGGVTDPWKMRFIAWQINEFLRRLGIQFYQGVHCSTQREQNHPHAHIVVNAILPYTGKKIQINRSFLRAYKWFANLILLSEGLPLIKIGPRSVPFRFCYKDKED